MNTQYVSLRQRQQWPSIQDRAGNAVEKDFMSYLLKKLHILIAANKSKGLMVKWNKSNISRGGRTVINPTNHLVRTEQSYWTVFGTNAMIGQVTCLSVYQPPSSSYVLCVEWMGWNILVWRFFKLKQKLLRSQNVPSPAEPGAWRATRLRKTGREGEFNTTPTICLFHELRCATEHLPLKKDAIFKWLWYLVYLIIGLFLCLLPHTHTHLADDVKHES